MVKKKRQSDAHEESSSDCTEENTLQGPSALLGSCQHVKKSVDTNKLRKQLKTTGLAFDCTLCTKSDANSNTTLTNSPINDNTNFEYDNTLWICLKCGTQLCGRARNEHALKHFQTPHSESHALAMNTRSFEIWCYECDIEVKANSRKNLVECVEIVKKSAQKPPTVIPGEINDVEGKIRSTWEAMLPLVPTNVIGTTKNPIPLGPPSQPIPGMAKRVNDPSNTHTGPSTLYPLSLDSRFSMQNPKCELIALPRVRGLTNLGNTCFFNAVMQCLAQTPYLLEVLNELSEPGEEFILPGGTFKFKDDVDKELPMIKGTLSPWGGLTAALANALEELQSGGDVFNPSRVFEKLCIKCPQFKGGDQHDSHELLRHLLESVRSEDLKRYQRVILQNLGYKDQDVNSVSEEMRKKCKIYGEQAADRILRPEQVFRGFLVSTLTCQECYSVSSRHEYFLDMSLPVSVEKPQPPQRRKSSPDNTSNDSFNWNPAPTEPTKAQLKKQAEKERKAKRKAKHQNNKLVQKQRLEDVIGASGDGTESTAPPDNSAQARGELTSSSTSSEQSDADVEDNLIDDNEKAKPTPLYDPNGNNALSNRGNPEKRGDSPENMDKDSLDEDENDSGIATSPANAVSETNGGGTSSDANSGTNNSVVAIGLSEKGASIVRQLSLGESSSQSPRLTNGEVKEKDLSSQLEQLKLKEQKAARMKAKRVRTQSYSDWSSTIGPRYQCEDGECSVQSCLNNFTAVELMTGNNKVGCDNCTKRINGDDPEAKTVNTNATKQFLISSPPAVLILHLKRFQLGPRCIFRKLTRAVSFPMVLDIAPFCGSKVKNLPNIDRKQKKLLYALYGVVEHAGGMYGGHYTAYVKVRPKLSTDDKRWKFLPQGSKAELDQDDEQRKKLDELLAKEKARDLRMKAAEDSDDFSNSSSASLNSSSGEEENNAETDADSGAVGGAEEVPNVQVPMGKWYYVSDSRVQEASEDSVLRSQAYLLFYERIY